MKTKQKYKETYFREHDDILTRQEEEDGYIQVVLGRQFEGKKRVWDIMLIKDGWINDEEYRATLSSAEAYAKKLAKAKGINRIVIFMGAKLINL